MACGMFIMIQRNFLDFDIGLQTFEVWASDLTDGAECELIKRGPGLPGGTL